MANDTLALVRECERQGLRVERRRNGWFVYSRHRNGAIVTIHETPSDWRGLHNTIARLKRIGFRPDEAIRHIEDERQERIARANVTYDNLIERANARLAEEGKQLTLPTPEQGEEVKEDVTTLAETKPSTNFRTEPWKCEHCGQEGKGRGPHGQHMKYKHPELFQSKAPSLDEKRARDREAQKRYRARKVTAPVASSNGEHPITAAEMRKMLDAWVSSYGDLQRENARLRKKLEQVEQYFAKGVERLV